MTSYLNLIATCTIWSNNRENTVIFTKCFGKFAEQVFELADGIFQVGGIKIQQKTKTKEER